MELSPEIINEVNTRLKKKSSPEQIQSAINAVRVVYEKHMGKFPPVPDAVFLEMLETFSTESVKGLEEKLGIDLSEL